MPRKRKGAAGSSLVNSIRNKRKQNRPTRLTIKQRKSMTWCMDLGQTGSQNISKFSASGSSQDVQSSSSADACAAETERLVIHNNKKQKQLASLSTHNDTMSGIQKEINLTLQSYSEAIVLQLPNEVESGAFAVYELKAVSHSAEFRCNVELSRVSHAILCLQEDTEVLTANTDAATHNTTDSQARGALFIELKDECKSVLSFEVQLDCASVVRAVLQHVAFSCSLDSVAHFGASSVFTICVSLRRNALIDLNRNTPRTPRRARSIPELTRFAAFVSHQSVKFNSIDTSTFESQAEVSASSVCDQDETNVTGNLDISGYDALFTSAETERTIEQFYQYVKHEPGRHTELSHDETTALSRLVRVYLRSYQMQAVSWMLRREADQPTRVLQDVIDTNLIAIRRLHTSTATQSQFVHYCPFNSGFYAHLQAAQAVRGGILADEMGLGKTVELLCTILLHRRPQHELGSADFFVRAYQNTRYSLNTLSEAQSAAEQRDVGEVGKLRIKSSQYWTPRDWSNVKRLACVCGFESETEEQRQRIYTAWDDAERAASAAKKLKLTRSANKEPTKRNNGKPKIHTLANELEVECHVCGMRQHAKCVRFDQDELGATNYVCPLCIQNAPVRLPIGATLIIVPATLVGQWLSELQKLAATPLRVLVYDGISCTSAASSTRFYANSIRSDADSRSPDANATTHEYVQVQRVAGYVQPSFLALFDVVLVTYETLRSELHHAPRTDATMSVSRYGFRAPKRYVAAPCPLLAVAFWRVCLDEAQMVETVTSAHAEMTNMLQASIRWCVTGTPLQTSVRDLFGLFTFLGCHPFTISRLFDDLLYRPFCGLRQISSVKSCGKEVYICGLVKLCGELMWRNIKADVADQMLLPPHREVTSSIDFSPFERHFYNRQLEFAERSIRETLSKAHLSVADYDTRLLASIERDFFIALLGRLTSVRQACCHPQAVRSDFLSLAVGSQNVVSMHELLRAMLARTRTECEEAHRELIGALNGLAALALLRSDQREAARVYREALGSIRANEAFFRTDMLQQLHIAHNLHELLRLHADELDGRAISDDSLPELANQIRNKYLARANATVRVAAARFGELFAEVTQLHHSATAYDTRSTWWLDVLNAGIERQLDTSILEKVTNELAAETQRTRRPTSAAVVFQAVTDIRGLSAAVAAVNDKLERLRQAALASVDKIASILRADWRILQRSKQSVTSLKFAKATTNQGEQAADSETASMSIDDFDAVVNSREVREAIACCLREDVPGVPKLRGGGVCLFCRSETAILDYENELFVHYEPTKKVDSRKLRTRDDVDDDDDGLAAALAESAAEQESATGSSGASLRRKESILSEKTVRQHFGVVLNAQTNAGSNQPASGADRAVESIWFDCELLTVLKCLYSFHKNNKLKKSESDALADAGRAQLKAFVCMKEELIRLRNLWIELRHEAAAFDELNMAVSRTRLLTDDDQGPDAFLSVHSAAYKRARFANVEIDAGAGMNIGANTTARNARTCLDALREADIEPQRLNLIGQRAQAEAELRRKKGHIFYLQNLEKSASLIDERGVNPDACPICQSQLGIEWTVLVCGHCLCVSCTNQLHPNVGVAKTNPHSTVFKCPVCRESVPRSGMTLVKLENKHLQKKPTAADCEQPPSQTSDAEEKRGNGADQVEDEDEDEEVKLVGDTSSKVYELVRRIMLLVRRAKRSSSKLASNASANVADCSHSESNVKVLVFSNWVEMLDIIAKALTDNGIEYRAAYPGHRFAQSLAAFKQDSSVLALLMPFRSCASGLNLTEANHVFLVEPVLNAAIGKQAVGRIQRIGQTRPTFVHRFIVNDSIEQKLHAITHDGSSIGKLTSDSAHPNSHPQSPSKQVWHLKGKTAVETEESGCSKLTVSQFLRFFHDEAIS